MKRRSIIIIDSKWHCGNSWKKVLGKEHEIAVLRDFSIIEKICRGGAVNLAILNAHLQKEFDLNIFRRFRQSFPSIPIIAAISYRCSWDKEELRKYGIEHTVKKPFSIQTLEEKIEEVLCEQVTCSAS